MKIPEYLHPPDRLLLQKSIVTRGLDPEAWIGNDKHGTLLNPLAFYIVIEIDQCSCPNV